MRYLLVKGVIGIFKLSPKEILKEHRLLLLGLIIFVISILLHSFNELLFGIIALIGFSMIGYDLYEQGKKEVVK